MLIRVFFFLIFRSGGPAPRTRYFNGKIRFGSGKGGPFRIRNAKPKENERTRDEFAQPFEFDRRIFGNDH